MKKLSQIRRKVMQRSGNRVSLFAQVRSSVRINFEEVDVLTSNLYRRSTYLIVTKMRYPLTLRPASKYLETR